MPTTHRYRDSSSPTFRNNLPRGKACMSCRRRKIKCDGRKPSCGQCRRSPGTADDCEYPVEGRSRTQQLEETIKKLHSRIGELEAAAEGGLYLHEPYDVVTEPTFVKLKMEESPASASPLYMDSWSMSPRSTSPTSRVNTPNSASTSSTLSEKDPPPEVAISLIDTFLAKFTQAELFFLSPTTFRRCAGLPGTHPNRPSPALLNAVFMWGARLSSAADEETYLMRALHHIHFDLGSSSRTLLHATQAEVLLSLYYLTLGRPVEGTYHCSAAVSLTMSAGLHRLGSSASSSGSMFDLGDIHARSLDLGEPEPPPENERIAAFWSVLIVSNYWSVAHSPAAAASALSAADIDTPWPQDVLVTPKDWMSTPSGEAGWMTQASSFTDGSEYVYGDYDEGADLAALPLPAYSSSNGMGLHEPSSMVEYPLPQFHGPASSASASNSSSPISRFLNGEGDSAFSNLALLAKASILLEKAVAVSSRCTGFSLNDVNSASLFLDDIIERFTNALPPLSESSSSSNNVLIHLLARGATIRLHHPHASTSEMSRRRCLDAARATVALGIGRDDARTRPILGVLWTSAAEVLLGEFALALQLGAEANANELVGSLETLLGLMRACGRGSPIIEYFGNRAQQQSEQLTAMYCSLPFSSSGR
ncbi:hypothetical protein C8F01DRAFT_1142432 [Mycena amicta]|nr:hypothetical protein C8F01DRAFT_1142432 [Mycena amicta]